VSLFASQPRFHLLRRSLQTLQRGTRRSSMRRVVRRHKKLEGLKIQSKKFGNF